MMFTAYNITLALRHLGQQVHGSEVRPHVHEIMNTCVGYEKHFVNPPGMWLYHPTGADYSQFQLNAPPQAGETKAVPPVSVTINVQTQKSPVPGLVTGKTRPSADGRLKVSPRLLNDIGLYPGDSVTVMAESGKIIVQKESPSAYVGHVWKYTVNQDGRIRISPDAIRHSFKISDGNFLIGKSGNQLEIKLA